MKWVWGSLPATTFDNPTGESTVDSDTKISVMDFCPNIPSTPPTSEPGVGCAVLGCEYLYSGGSALADRSDQSLYYPVGW